MGDTEGQPFRVQMEPGIARLQTAIAQALLTPEGTAAANWAMTATGSRSRYSIWVLGVLGAGKTQLLANFCSDGSRAQELAFSRVTHDRPAPHRDQTYLIRESLYSLKLIDSAGLEPGHGIESYQAGVSAAMFPTDLASSVDIVWLCATVDNPKALNADAVQAVLAQLEHAGLPTIVVMTKADTLYFEEVVTGSAPRRLDVERVMDELKSRFSVIKDHVYVSTYRSPQYESPTQPGRLLYPHTLNDLLVETLDHAEEAKLSAYARSTAVVLDAKMTDSAEVILRHIRRRLVGVTMQPIPMIGDAIVGRLLKHTISNVYTAWDVDEAARELISTQLLNKQLIWNMTTWMSVKLTAYVFGLSALHFAVGPIATVVGAVALDVTEQAIDFYSLVHATIRIGLIQTGVLAQLSLMTGGNNRTLAQDPDAEQKVQKALTRYNDTCHQKVEEFCGSIKGKYKVFTAEQLKELRQQLHQFMCELHTTTATEGV